MPLSISGSCCLATKSLRDDLNAAQTQLNEKLLEVNICLSCVFSVMFSNCKAAGLLSLEYASSILPENLANHSSFAEPFMMEQVCFYLPNSGDGVISCLFRRLN